MARMKLSPQGALTAEREPTENATISLTDPCYGGEGPGWPQSLPYLFELQREAAKAAGVEWKHNALRHSFISYRVADIKNVDQVALEAGNSPAIIFQHYRELVAEVTAKEWFGVTPALVEAEKEELTAEGAKRKADREKAEAEKAGGTKKRKRKKAAAETAAAAQMEAAA